MATVLAGPGSSVPDSLLNPNEKYRISELLCHVLLWAQYVRSVLVASFLAKPEKK